MKRIGIIVGIISLLLTGCGQGEKVATTESHSEHASHVSQGDLQETTQSADVLPRFLDGKPEAMRVIYQAAASQAELLEWIPCYCGCGESAGHLNSLNCFVSKINRDGSILWDDHGTRCDTCLEIAASAINQKLAGKTVQEIRADIDKRYQEGYAKPTKTKLPNA